MLTVEGKSFYTRRKRDQEPAYNPVVGPNGNGLAYIVSDGAGERLLYRAGPDTQDTLIASATYILSPHCCGDHLLWVEQRGGQWVIRGVELGLPRETETPFAHWGRPIHLTSCQGQSGGYLFWEERQGMDTKIRGARCQGKKFDLAVDVIDPPYNVYDPACTVTEDGTVYLIYSAFTEGNYRVLLQRFDQQLQAIGEAVRISDGAQPAVYPSICTRKDGGVWISYTAFPGRLGQMFVQHYRRQAQHGFFGCAPVVRAGIFDGKSLWGVRCLPGQQGYLAAWRVDPARGGGHSHIIEDPWGRVHLLLRQHRDFQPASLPGLEDALVSEPRGTSTGLNTYAQICWMTLADKKWTDPVPLVPMAFHESAVSFVQQDGHIRLAFVEDGRHTGWNKNGEWFDSTGELGIGQIELSLPEGDKPQYELRQVTKTPVAGPSMEEPRLQAGASHDGFLHAMGQTHTHTTLSVCARGVDRDPHLNYRFMQDVQHCHFGATTDHGYNMWQSEQVLVNKLAAYYYFPGQFVAIPAYEWTGSAEGVCSHDGGPFGHVNPLYLEEEGALEIFTPCDPQCTGASLEKLWNTYKEKKILTPPHHVADNAHPYNWNFFDEEFTPVIEIFQDSRGSGEQPQVAGVTNSMHRLGNHWALEALRSGKRFGFIAGADHYGLSLAGVLVSELTRSALYDAMRAKRTFGTTGISLRLDFRCNGRCMGSSVSCQEGAFSLQVTAPEAITEIEIVRNGDAYATLAGDGCSFTHRWQVTKERPGEFWYVRVIMANGEMAWSSPIWLD